jgi:hypothetical protein
MECRLEKICHTAVQNLLRPEAILCKQMLELTEGFEPPTL